LRLSRISARANRASLLLILAAFTVLAAPAVPAMSPTLVLKDLSGKENSLADFKGKIVVLNFWATWCEPCQDEMPMLNKLARSYAERNIVFLAVSIDDPKDVAKIPRFLEKHKISLLVWVGATPETLKDFDLGKMIPATVIFDADGTPIGRILGQARRNDVTSRLDWLLAGKPGNPPKPIVKHL
jgi:thiol-disulfide isomerase/thioredoxin